MDLESFLKKINVSEGDIKRLTEEKIDCNVISLMSDEELAWFLKSAGDRVLVRNFAKTLNTSGQRKEHLVRNIRERLAAIRSKRTDKSSERKPRVKHTARGGGPNTKSTRQLYLGWKHREGGRVIQVIEKKGGGTKLLSMPKDYRKTGIIELAKKLYFPGGRSTKGEETKFKFDLIDSSNQLIPPNKTVLEILEEKSPKIPRLYLATERMARNINEVERSMLESEDYSSDEDAESAMTKMNKDIDEPTDRVDNSLPEEEYNMEPANNEEQIVKIYYADTSISKYTGEKSVSFEDKQEVFHQICDAHGLHDVDYEHFDPVNFNYRVARIEVNGMVTFNNESEFLPQTHDIPNTSSGLTAAATSSAETSSVSEILLPIVERRDLKLSEKILGAGSQGTVREGNWLGTQVAVKSFKTGKLTQTELREVQLLTRIRHPHIIQIMGISLENRQTHLIFELVKGDNLGDILFDSEKKKKYNLDNETKAKILYQSCQAISYLHGQCNPIIHRDIKPDNILVSENFVVKLCDLGLAKLKNMATQFRTVIGSIKGTVAYMPPEILLSAETATTFSDIWSLGCTILETYSEEDVWPDLTDDFTHTLVEKMKKLDSPNVSLLPAGLQPIVQRCFSYNPTERPGIEELMRYFSATTVAEDNI